MTDPDVPAEELSPDPPVPLKRYDRQAIVTAVLVMLVGAVFGGVLYRYEQTRATWRPSVERTAGGWRISSRYGHGPEGFGLKNDHLVWATNLAIITMDMRNGKTKLLDDVNRQQVSALTVSDRYSAWTTVEDTAAGAVTALHTYDFVSGKRSQFNDVGNVYEELAISGSRLLWLGPSETSDSPDIKSIDIETGERSVLVPATTQASGQVALNGPRADGDLVAWTARTGGGQGPTVFAFKDLATGREWTCDPHTPGGDSLWLSWRLSGRTVAFSWQAPNTDQGGEIVTLNADTNIRTTVVRGIDLQTPAIDGDLVAWWALQGDQTEILGSRQNGAEPFTIAVTGHINGDSLLVSGGNAAWLGYDSSGSDAWIETQKLPR